MNIPKEVTKALDKIEIGRDYKIVGTHGGCNGDHCSSCIPGIVTVNNKRDDDTGFTDHVGFLLVAIASKTVKYDQCSVDPRDLHALRPNWKNILTERKK